MQVAEIVNLAAAKARKGAHPSWALSTPGALQHGSRSPRARSESGDAGPLPEGGERSVGGAEGGQGGLQSFEPSFLDAENSQLRAASSVVRLSSSCPVQMCGVPCYLCPL